MKQEEKQQHMLKTAKDTYGNITVISAEKNILHFTTEDKSITYTCHNNGKIDESVRWRRGHKPASKNSKGTKSAHKEEKAKAKKAANKSDRHDSMHQLTFEDILDTSPAADRNKKTDKSPVSGEPGNDSRIQEKPIVKKRHRRTKAEIEAEEKISEQDIPGKSSDTEKGFTNSPTDNIQEKQRKSLLEESRSSIHEPAANKKETAKKIRPDVAKAPVKEKADKKEGKSTPSTGQESRKNSNDTESDGIVFMRETPCPYKRGESVESVYSGRAYTVLSTLGNTARVVTSDTKSERFEFTICAADLKVSKKAPLILDDATT